MNKKELIIDGCNFSNLNEFYIEVDRVFTKDLTWETGHNLNAFNDLLHGGFGVHEYGEPITIIWKNVNKSKLDLGYNETVRHYENMLKECHPTNINSVKALLENAQKKKGETLFDIIIEIINEHDDIELILRE
ncbi:hypothetical protein [Clostridium baratii]|uniref:barstar family protein n=1 Tax=Clostridium baratii TaxID=1561 RepID=UPI0029071DAB|nr:hypothetical protein [Clostridium baratii]MDU4910574.1 hypothetical protein [Clostridium baratii]